VGLTQIYQQNIRGGMSTHRRSGRYQGGYDLEMDFDLEKLAGVKGGRVYVLAEGSWSDGIDISSIGSIFGANADAAGYQAVVVTQLFYEQALCDGLWVRIGKIDLTGGF